MAVRVEAAGPVHIENCVIDSNQIAIVDAAAKPLTVRGSELAHNTGSALLISSLPVSLNSNDIYDNGPSVITVGVQSKDAIDATGMPDKLGILLGRDAPLLFEMGRELVFLSVRRTSS